MGILTRFKDIMSANINALLDKAEDPEKMIDQYLRNAKSDLAEVRKETAGVMAEEKRAKEKVDSINKEINDLTELAKKALQAGNRDDASVFVSKKQKIESELPGYIDIHSSAVSNANQMRELHNKLVDDIRGMESRKDMLKGKAAATRARETVNKMGATSDRYGLAMGKMNEMEERINADFNKAIAESELLNGQDDEATKLADKYKGGNTATVDNELDNLEIELGLKKRE